MDNELKAINSKDKKKDEVYTPFVDDGCGDVLWDDVLKSLEEAEKERLAKLAKSS